MVAMHDERITARDGGGFEAFCAVPDTGSGPAVLLLQEIFGINDNMRGLARRLAGHGYLVLVPDMFWRLQPRYERNDESSIPEGAAMAQRFDPAAGAADLTATFAHALSMPQCTGKVGGVGFCFGGTLAYLFAATARVAGRGPDAVVSYYGSGVPDMLDQLGSIQCPILFHFGDQDPYIPTERVDAVADAVTGRPNMQLRRYDAGHAFSNWDTPSLYDKAAAEEAWQHTLGFLATHLEP